MTPDFKRCRRCGVAKPRADFYRNTAKSDGLNTYCRPCDNARGRKWRLSNPDRYNEKKRRWRERNLQRERKREATWAAANLEKRRAQNAVYRAVKAGRLTRPDGECERCGETGRRIHAHHEDHAQPLAVMWLCPPCHGQRHLEIGR